MAYIIIIIFGFVLINEILNLFNRFGDGLYGHSAGENIDKLLNSFHPEIHYRKVSERGKAYLRKICPPNTPYAKDRLEIILDFTTDVYSVFLLKNEKGEHFLRIYTCSENPDGIDRYVLHNLMPQIFRKLKKDETSRLNRYCMDVLGKPAAECDINMNDSENTKESNLNTYAITFSGVITSRDEAARIMETKVMTDSSNRDDEFEDFDPDIDEVPDGYKLNELGELELDSDLPEDPNRRGSEAWWKEQERFINDSLYVNHDWDIFKKEEKEKDNK